MSRYSVEFAASAAKEFRLLPVEVKHRLGSTIDGLYQNPRPVGVRKLRGHTNFYRIRVGQHRVVYEIDDKAQFIRITRIRHRRDAYR